MTWQYPSIWFLLLLLFVPLIVWRMWARRRWTAVKFSSTRIAGSLRTTLKVRLRWLLPALRIAGLIVLIVALARPQKGNEKTRIFSEGIAIEMVVDRSGSMSEPDFTINSQRVTRLDAVKDVASKFVNGNGKELKGRGHDMVGMITFARFADNVSPLTLDHSYLTDKLNMTEIVKTRSENWTAIGDAIGLGVEQLRTLKERKNADGEIQPIKSKVIILLTDGENNQGDLSPKQAAELAKTMGVKIYTIGIGTKGLAPMPVMDFTGRQFMRNVPVNIDEDTLKEIAKITGGRYFRATDTDSLEKIYETIDQLEKTKIDERRFAEYRELAIKPIRAGAMTFPPLMLLAFVLLAAEGVLANTWLRQIP